jgi:hypothetical protein
MSDCRRRGKFRTAQELLGSRDKLEAHDMLDCRMTNRFKYRGKALPLQIVRGTWEGVLKNESELPKEWEKGPNTGVLVGMEPIG